MLNLDNDQSTNFEVYKDDTLVISKSTYNVLKSADEESGKYVFTNCNEELKSLASGDVFSYKYDSGKTLIVKVKDISVSGSTVTVTDDGNAELADIFDYVKIEASESVAKIDPSSASDGVTVETGESSVSSSDDDKSVESVGISYEGGMSDTLNAKIDLWGDSDEDGVSGSVNVTLSVSVGVDIYINSKVWEYKTHYIDFSIEYGASVSFNYKSQISKTIDKVLATLEFTPVTGVNVVLKPKISFSASADISIVAKVEGKFGFNASFAHGVQNTSKAPEFKLPEFNFEGELFVGFDLSPSMNIVTPGLAETSLDMKLGATISASPTEDDEEIHKCKVCLSGTIAPTFSIEVSAKIIGKVVGSYNKTFEIVKFPFYFSVDHLEFGFGECPYVISKKCGDDAYWKLDDDGTLIIYGKGKMYDYAYHVGAGSYNAPPWLEFKNKIKKVIIKDGITSIGFAGFTYCSGFTSITIPDSVTEIGDYAFCGCESLKSITIPDGVTEIGYKLFAWCRSLISITIPDGVTEIGDDVFYVCESLASITIPDSVTKIGEDAFAHCTSLTSITIPSGVRELKETFYCSALKEIYFKGDCPAIGRRTFYGVTATLYYPTGNNTYNNFDPNSSNCNITLVPYDYSSSVAAAAPQSTAVKVNTSVKANTPADPDIVNVKANYNNKIAGFEYMISVVKNEKAEDVLSSANLIYMTQVRADKNGNISVSLPIGSDVTDYKVMIFGPEKGDMYKDGGIDVLDVTKLQQYLAGDNDISYIPVEVADIDNDGKVTVNDVTRLQLYLAKKISTLS